MVSKDEELNFRIVQQDILSREKQHLERRGHDGALRNGRRQLCHGRIDSGLMHDRRKAQIDQSLVVGRHVLAYG